MGCIYAMAAKRPEQSEEIEKKHAYISLEPGLQYLADNQE
jgi:hypothetical protein